MSDKKIKNQYITINEIITNNSCSVENYIYFFSCNFNVLCRLRSSDLIIEPVFSDPKWDICEEYLYSDLQYINGKIYMTPSRADSILIYDTNSHEVENIYLERSEYFSGFRYKFRKSLVYEDSVIFIPFRYDAIVELNTKTNEVKYYKQWNEFYKKIYDEPEFYFKENAFIEGNKIFLQSKIDNKIFEFSLINKSIKNCQRIMEHNLIEKMNHIQTGKDADKIINAMCDSGICEYDNQKQIITMRYTNGQIKEKHIADSSDQFVDYVNDEFIKNKKKQIYSEDNKLGLEGFIKYVIY